MSRAGPSTAFAGIALLLASTAAAAQNLVVNGGFEDGSSGWTVWDSAEPGYSPWLRDASCVSFPPSMGCVFEGDAAYSHRLSAPGAARGGIYQSIQVQPARQYRISGHWSGGVHPNSIGNYSSWTVAILEGTPQPSTLDPGAYPTGTIVADEWVTMPPPLDPRSFPWTRFDGLIRTSDDTTTVTIVFRQFGQGMGSGAAYLDGVTMTLVDAPSPPIPLGPRGWFWGMAAVLLLYGVRRLRHAHSAR